MPVIDLGPVVGPQGPQGATGAAGAQGIQGTPGPNQVSSATSTPLNGVLAGNGTSVTVKPVDSMPTENSTNLVSSGGVLSSRVPINGMGKNLLHNWYFVSGGGSGYGTFPINQRGQTSYSGNGKTIDMWRFGTYGGSVNILSNGIKVDVTSSGQAFSQAIMYPVPSLLGKTVTATILTSAGVLYTKSGTLPTTEPGSTTSYITQEIPNVGNLFVNYASSRSRFAFGIENSSASTTYVTVQAAKLEFGNQQTLCHNEGTVANPVWVLNQIPDYPTELLKCQQHLYAMSRYNDIRASAIRSNVIYFSVPIPTPMIGTVTLENSSVLVVHSLTGAEQTGFTFSIGQGAGTYLQIAAEKTSHGMSDAVLHIGQSGPLRIVAE